MEITSFQNNEFFHAGIMVQSIFWNHEHNILAGIQETTLTVWYYPGIVFVDPRLLRRSTLIKDTRYNNMLDVSTGQP